MLCALCLSVFSSGRRTGSHHACLEDLQRAAQGGCKICIFLALRREKLGPDPENEETAMPFLQYRWGPYPNLDFARSTNYRPHSWIGFDSTIRWLSWGVMPGIFIEIYVSYMNEVVPDWYTILSGYAVSDLNSEPWRVRREMFPLRPIPDTTGDERVLEVGKMWLENCCRFHDCERLSGPVDPKWYPKRLVYLTDATSPRLVETCSECPLSRYATLSHCWGSDSNFVTLTTGNLDGFRKGIPMDILPKSFRDAVFICNELSIRYIWIDSLCILQDSESDWLLHAKEMSLIYQNCYINLSFDAAANPHEGAFRHRNTDVLQECFAFSLIPEDSSTGSDNQFSSSSSDISSSDADDALQSTAGDGNNGEIDPIEADSRESESVKETEPRMCWVFARDFDFTSSTRNLPLATRGWVIQERLLSPRVLHFTDNRIMWECGESLSLQEGLPRGFLGSGKSFDAEFRHAFNCFPGGEPYSSQSYHSNQWDNIVRAYSSCLLTYPEKDKLVALAAVAQRFTAVFGEEYYAGHFRQTMPFNLVWGVLKRHRDNIPATRRYPTWSWTSVDAEVVTPAGLGNDHSLVDVESVSVTLVDESHKYGPVKEGQLRMRGLVARCVLGNSRSSSYFDIRTVYIQEMIGHNGPLLQTELVVSLDDPEKDIVEDVHIIPVVERKRSTRSTGRRAIIGLLLLKQAGEVYERVGSWHSGLQYYHDLENGPLFEWVDGCVGHRQLVEIV